MAESSALARALALERAALCFSPSERSSAFPSKSTETMQRIVSPPWTSVIENLIGPTAAGNLDFVH